jgi:outer membrane immunogenic protein
MHISKFLGVAAIALAVPSIAQAQARIEVHVGLDLPEASLALTDDTVTYRASDGRQAFNYGVEAGYDMRMGGDMIIGMYAGADASTAKVCGYYDDDIRGCLRGGRDIAIGLRAGTFVGDNTLLYIKGGYSNGQLRVSAQDLIDDDRAHVNINMDGWHAGAGIEHNFARNTYAKVEYNYTNYANARIRADDFSASAGMARHRIVAGVGMNF